MDQQMVNTLIDAQPTHLGRLVFWIALAFVVALLFLTADGRTWLEDGSAWLESVLNRVRDGLRNRAIHGEAITTAIETHLRETPTVVIWPAPPRDARDRAKRARLVLVHSRSTRS